MEVKTILAVTMAGLLVAGGAFAQDNSDDGDRPPPRPRSDAPGPQGPLTEEQRQAAQERFEGMTDEERAAAREQRADSGRAGGFTEEERQAMRERRGAAGDGERPAQRDRGQLPGGDQAGGRFPGGGQAGGQFPGGGQAGGQFPGGGGMSRGGMGRGQ